jgi:hypothetical protein
LAIEIGIVSSKNPICETPELLILISSLEERAVQCLHEALEIRKGGGSLDTNTVAVKGELAGMACRAIEPYPFLLGSLPTLPAKSGEGQRFVISVIEGEADGQLSGPWEIAKFGYMVIGKKSARPTGLF